MAATLKSSSQFSSVASSTILQRPQRQLSQLRCVSGHQKHQPYLLRASSQDNIPAEIREDPKFVPINNEDPSYGPTAMLLVGFESHEIPKVMKYLKDMDADFVKVIVCSESMLRERLWDCMQRPSNITSPPSVPQLPRICFLSGMTGQEVVTIVHTFPRIGLQENAFAALVPKNAEQALEQVMEEVMGDHERLRKA